MTQLSLHLNFMGHFIFKYLMVIGVVLTGFQCSAFTDEKDKDKKKDQTTVTRTDTTKIKVNLDIQADDTLVFDDFDEDKDDKGDNSTIAHAISGPIKTCIIPAKSEEIRWIACGFNRLSVKEDSTTTDLIESEEKITQLQTTIYPNPASANNQTIYISHNLSSAVTVTVYSLSGQVINSMSATEQKVELPSLASGIYIVNIAGEGQSDSQRLLVQ